MAPRERLPFTLLDAMILVAALAAGIAPLRPMHEMLSGRPLSRSANAEILAAITMGQSYAVPPLACLSIGLVCCGLRHRPGAAWRRIVRRPGFAACVVASALAAFFFATRLAMLLRMKLPADLRFEYIVMTAAVVLPTMIGSAMLGGAIALLVVGRFRPATTWIDRFGLVLGAGWIAVLIAGEARGLF